MTSCTKSGSNNLSTQICMAHLPTSNGAACTSKRTIISCLVDGSNRSNQQLRTPEDSALAGWGPMFANCCAKSSRDLDTIDRIKARIENAGFINVHFKEYKVPVGDWAKHPRLKEAGMLLKQHLLAGLEGYVMIVLTNFGEPQLERQRKFRSILRPFVTRRTMTDSTSNKCGELRGACNFFSHPFQPFLNYINSAIRHKSLEMPSQQLRSQRLNFKISLDRTKIWMPRRRRACTTHISIA